MVTDGEEIEESVSVKGLSSCAYRDRFGTILVIFVFFLVVCNGMECEKDFGGEVRSSQKNVENKKKKNYFIYSAKPNILFY